MRERYPYAFTGVHCETTATGTLLKQIGIDLSEPMLFGLAQGLGFIYWNMKCMDFPFIGGRIKPDFLTKNLAALLNLKLDIRETTSIKKAWANVEQPLADGKPVGLKLDCYHLDYFTSKIHFAAHYTALYKLDDQFAYLIDTSQQGKTCITSRKSLELARSAKGPMSSRNLSYTLEKSGDTPPLCRILPVAIRRNAEDFLTPPIQNIGYKGIAKTSREIAKWFERTTDKYRDFTTTAMLMEKAGTGGALFRNLYRDFLLEAQQHIDSPALIQAYQDYTKIAEEWTEVAALLNHAGETATLQPIHDAAALLTDLSIREKATMEQLLRL